MKELLMLASSAPLLPPLLAMAQSSFDGTSTFELARSRLSE